MKAWTFSRKVSASIALASLLVSIVLSGFVYITFSQWSERQEADLLEAKLRQFELRIGDVTFLTSLLRPGLGKGSGAAAVLKPDLSSFAADLDKGQRLQMLDLKDRVLAEAGTGGVDKAASYKAESHMTLPAYGDVKLRLTDSGYSRTTTAVREVGRILLFGLIIAAGVAIVAGWIVARSALKPIRSMIGEVQSIGANNLSKRLQLPAAQDELHQLGATFNGLLQKLSVSFDQQRRFVADASHELKTPLAIIEGHTHMIQRWGKKSPEVLEESLTFMIDESRRMKELIAQLLLLAATEEPLTDDTGDMSCDLKETLNELLPQTVHVNPEVKLSVQENQSGEALLIRMPASAGYQVLRNIVENALKYTPAGGMVNIAYHTEAGGVILSVTDTGTGISSGQLPHVFDRFYRTEDSRNRTQGGSGLGLAIVKAIMERYGGSITIESTPGLGTKVTLRFVQG